MARRNVVLPSGLSGTVRGLKGKEINLFDNASGLGNYQALDAVLRNCWLETSDAGVYASSQAPPDGRSLKATPIRPVIDGAGKVNWERALSGDRFKAFIEIRVATGGLGENYYFQLQCANKDCEPFKWRVPLSKLVVQELSEEHAEAFRNGNRLETTVDGRCVVYKLSTGLEEERIHRLRVRNKVRPLTETAMRIVSIEGVELPDTQRDVKKLMLSHELKMSWLEDLELEDVHALGKLMNNANCGVETTVKTICPSCDRGSLTALPFGREFIVPPTDLDGVANPESISETSDGSSTENSGGTSSASSDTSSMAAVASQGGPPT